MEQSKIARTVLLVLTNVLVGVCLLMLSDMRDAQREDRKDLKEHLKPGQEIHETTAQKTLGRRDTARSIIHEWDRDVNAPRWKRLDAQLIELSAAVAALRASK